MPGLDKSSKKAREREKKAKERERKKEARILTLRELFSFAEIKHCRREELSRRIRAGDEDAKKEYAERENEKEKARLREKEKGRESKSGWKEV